MILLLLLVHAALQGAEVRTWTNERGVTVEGELVKAGEKEIELKLKDGGTGKIPRAILSAEDEGYIVEWLSRTPDGNGNQLEGKPDAGKEREQWPLAVRNVDVSPVLVQKADGAVTYESPHFIYEAAGLLSDREIRALSRELETGFNVLRALPLPLDLVEQARRRYTVRIVFSDQDWKKLGGPQQGRFKAMPAYFLARMYRAQDGRPIRVESLDAMHELAHWFTQYAGHHFWFNEGLARYLELGKRKPGRIDFTDDLNRVALALPRVYRRGWEPLASLPGILFNPGGVEETREQLTSLIVATYFLRLDGKGDGERITAYMAALQKGEKDRRVLLDILLDGRSMEQLEQDIRNAWSPYLNIKFDTDQPPAP